MCALDAISGVMCMNLILLQGYVNAHETVSGVMCMTLLLPQGLYL